MNLILQAIKSLFRKVENSIQQTATVLGKRIDKAQSTANTAKTNASKANANALTAQQTAQNAQITADAAKVDAKTAQTTANNAQTAANHVLHATVSGYTATITTSVTLEDGKIYCLIPDATTSHGGNATIKLGSISYAVYAGVTACSVTSYSAQSPGASTIFRENIPIPIMYCAKKSCFYVLSKHAHEYVEVDANYVAPDAGQFIYGYYTNKHAKLFKYMRVKSSTEGSSKYFDITVDDSGTITATEVT